MYFCIIFTYIYPSFIPKSLKIAQIFETQTWDTDDKGLQHASAMVCTSFQHEALIL